MGLASGPGTPGSEPLTPGPAKRTNHCTNLLWRPQQNWENGPTITGYDPSCFPLTSWFWADPGKHRIRLCSGSIILSNCLYLKPPKNYNGLIKLVTLWHPSPHGLTPRPFSLTEKSGTSLPFCTGWLPGGGGAAGWGDKERRSWWKLSSPCGRWPTNLQTFGVHKTELWGRSRD